MASILTAGNKSQQHTILSKTASPVRWAVFILYVVVAAYTMAHHELWGDEIHSWNIAKGSKSVFDLLSNTRYEGHPPIWYAMLWSICKFTHDPVALQFLNLIISYAVVFIILFYSPFPTIIKALIPFGYFFIFHLAETVESVPKRIFVCFLSSSTLAVAFNKKKFESGHQINASNFFAC